MGCTATADKDDTTTTTFGCRDRSGDGATPGTGDNDEGGIGGDSGVGRTVLDERNEGMSTTRQGEGGTEGDGRGDDDHDSSAMTSSRAASRGDEVPSNLTAMDGGGPGGGGRGEASLPYVAAELETSPPLRITASGPLPPPPTAVKKSL